MSRKTILIQNLLSQKTIGIEITYPLCFKYGNENKGYTYYRYLEDGRYEMICIEPLKMHMSYGNQVQSIQGLINNDTFWFKQLVARHGTITEQEFENARKQYFDHYQFYLNGTEFIARDVEKLLATQVDHYATKNETDSIITNNNDKEDYPF